MAIAPNDHNRDEWPTKLFKMRGFARVELRYVPLPDRVYVYLERHLGGPPDTIDLPDGFRSMTLEAFRGWVDGEVAKLLGASDFPTISCKPAAPQYPGGIDDMGL